MYSHLVEQEHLPKNKGKCCREAHLKNSDKEECHDSRKCHVNHCKRDREREFEVLRRKDPLQSKRFRALSSQSKSR